MQRSWKGITLGEEREKKKEMSNPLCEVCGNEVEEVYPDEKHTLCDTCGDNHVYEGFAL